MSGFYKFNCKAQVQVPSPGEYLDLIQEVVVWSSMFWMHHMAPTCQYCLSWGGGSHN